MCGSSLNGKSDYDADIQRGKPSRRANDGDRCGHLPGASAFIRHSLTDTRFLPMMCAPGLAADRAFRRRGIQFAARAECRRDRTMRQYEG